jgi:hypothetical protein
MIEIDEFGRPWKLHIMACFNALSQHLHIGNEAKHTSKNSWYLD